VIFVAFKEATNVSASFHGRLHGTSLPAYLSWIVKSIAERGTHGLIEINIFY